MRVRFVFWFVMWWFNNGKFYKKKSSNQLKTWTKNRHLLSHSRYENGIRFCRRSCIVPNHCLFAFSHLIDSIRCGEKMLCYFVDFDSNPYTYSPLNVFVTIASLLCKLWCRKIKIRCNIDDSEICKKCMSIVVIRTDWLAHYDAWLWPF